MKFNGLMTFQTLMLDQRKNSLSFFSEYGVYSYRLISLTIFYVE